MNRFVHLSAIALLAAAGTAFGQAGGTIISGNTSLTIGAAPTSPTATAEPSANFITTGAGGTDHVFGNWWWYRLAGDNREFALNSSGGGATSSFAGSIGTMTQFYPSFRADITWEVQDTGSQFGYFTSTVAITNTTGSPITIDLFHYLDADFNGTAATDSASLVAPGLIRITDSAAPTIYGEYSAVNADNYQVGAFSTVRQLLTNTTVNNFNNSGLPFGPADFTGGFQWSGITISPGSTRAVTVSFAVVPAPASIALLGLGGLIAGRRRRA